VLKIIDEKKCDLKVLMRETLFSFCSWYCEEGGTSV